LVSNPRLNRLLQRKEIKELVDVPLPKGSRIYLVGGYIRDFLLRRKSHDIDLAIEGDFDQIFSRFKKRISGKVVNYATFQTGTIVTDRLRLDFARTRKESYPTPGALPKVVPADIYEDLRRRDFTINAMAVRLKPPPLTFIDPYNGYQDLKRGWIRILHEESFRDDPTRIFRAYRYARRFSFAIEPETKSLIKRDLHFITRLTPERIINELDLIAEEKEWYRIIRDLKNISIYRLIADRPLIRRGRGVTERKLFLHAHLKLNILENGPITVSQLKSAKEIKRVERIVAELKRIKKRSACYRTLSRLEPTTIEMIKELYPELKTKIRQFKRDVLLKPLITGSDLLNLGLKPSPLFRRILDRIRVLQVDRKIRSKKEAMQLIGQWISS